MSVKVVVESGDKRVMVSAVDWPGWTRSAKTREDALATFVEYAPRYKTALGTTAASLRVPKSVDDLDVVGTEKGGSGTDFGVPSAIIDADRQSITPAQLEDRIEMLKAAWKAFDRAAAAAKGRTLTTGPRGGGRKLAQIIEHVHEADRAAYIPSLGAKAPSTSATRADVEAAFIDALHAKIRGELPDKGPRGGERWPARYAIRRSAWHALDHAWEIEDRS